LSTAAACTWMFSSSRDRTTYIFINLFGATSLFAEINEVFVEMGFEFVAEALIRLSGQRDNELQ
jgi:hypothetical protein